MNDSSIAAWGAGLLQVSVAGYALRISRRFGPVQVGWSLFSVFALLALYHLVRACELAGPAEASGVTMNLVCGLISVLLFAGLAHIQMVTRTGLQREREELRLRSELAEMLERKTAEMAQANQQLQEEISVHKRAESQLSDANCALQDTMTRMNTLKGLLPICASCKKVRDTTGYWKRIEIYIMEHSAAQFTHGLCPDCVRDQIEEWNRGVRQDAHQSATLGNEASPRA